jgi:hypothetical protein
MCEPQTKGDLAVELERTRSSLYSITMNMLLSLHYISSGYQLNRDENS